MGLIDASECNPTFGAGKNIFYLQEIFIELQKYIVVSKFEPEVESKTEPGVRLYSCAL